MKLSSLTSGSAAALAILPGALSQLVQFRPEDNNDIAFRVNVPDSTTSESGPIFIQVDAPSEVAYIALGQGTGMAGANIFVVYASSDSNVTVSPRLGRGHSPPDSNPDGSVTVLEGSGITNGRMVANFRCNSCLSWDGGSMDPQDSSSSWIWSMGQGSPLESSDIGEQIGYHDTRGLFTLDLTQAMDGSYVNPFLELDVNDAVDSGAGGGLSDITKRRTAHGIMMAVVFVVLFPLFALVVPALPYGKKVPFIHAPLQLLTLAVAIAAFGIGINMAMDMGSVSHHHPIIGIVVISVLVLFQPALGLFQHLHFRKTQESSSLGVFHRWLGRAMIALGIVNGGLGLRWVGIGSPGASTGIVIAYSVVAGVIGIAYAAIALFSTFKKGRSGDHIDRIKRQNGAHRSNGANGW